MFLYCLTSKTKKMSLNVKILGPGCPKCKKLEKQTVEVVNELHLDAQVTKVEDIVEIMNYGVMRTPGLVINENVILSGHVPSMNELKKILQGY